MNGFLKLKIAMDLQRALQKHRRAMEVIKDKERSKFDKLSKIDKSSYESYTHLMWCIHIKDALKNGLLPDNIVVKYANIFCPKCGDRLIKNDWHADTGERKMYIPVQSPMLEQLVMLYCRENIDLFPFRE